MGRRSNRVAEARARVLPLDDLPAHMRERIEAQVAAPEPPDRWLLMGHPDDFRPIAQIPSRGWYEWWYWSRGIDPDSRRESLPQGMRQAVIERDGYVCQLCGGDVEPGDVHIDHIHPYSKGGGHNLSNLQVTHSRCNLKKGARADALGTV